MARHRWAASLGTAPEEGLLGDVPARGAPADGAPDPAAADRASPDGADAAESPVPAVFRWRSGRSAAAMLAVISVLLAGWFWWQAADGAPRVQSLGEPPGSEAADGSGPAVADDGGPDGAPSRADPAAAEMPGATAAGTIVVHVAGAVAKAGVVVLPRGSRIHEAIKAAGGNTRAADLDRLNLAAVLEDGQNLERNGLRCSAYNGGVACGNVSAGVAFFVSRDRYELISDAGKTASPGPSEAPKTP